MTGAARGIGAAVARSLADAGAAVALLDVAAAQLAETADKIRRARGHAIAVPWDVGSEPAVVAACEQVERELGPADLLACLAGVVGYAAVIDCDEGGWDRIMRVNAKGPFLIPEQDYAVMAVNNPSARERADERDLFERIVDLAARLAAGGITIYDGHVATEMLWIDQHGLNECDNLSETLMLRDLLRASLNAGDMIGAR